MAIEDILEELKNLMGCLKEREKIAIEMRADEKTFREIGNLFNVSPSRASQIYLKGVKKIRIALFKKGLISKEDKDQYLPYY